VWAALNANVSTVVTHLAGTAMIVPALPVVQVPAHAVVRADVGQREAAALA
jgi:hypothetical protein